MIVYAIKDKNTGTYFQSSHSSNGGWYGGLAKVRMYTKEIGAQRTVDAAGHHVTHPGNRSLTVVQLDIKEVS